MSKIVKLTAENFDAEIMKDGVTAIVDFYADWCGPCKMLAPILEQLERDNDDFGFYKVNVDENPELAAKYHVFTIPNVVIFKNGRDIAQSIGLKPAEEMQKILDGIK